MMNQRAQAYLRTKVMTASPVELRLMLVDGAIRFAGQCREGLSSRNFEQAFEGSRQCRAILTELLSGLKADHDPVLCQRLNSLYTFLISRMMEAMAEKNPQLIDSVVELLTYERETWQMVIDQQAGENVAAAAVPANVTTQVTASTTAGQVDTGSATSGLVGGRLHLAG
ncbi:MAG: flagellar export chaperone FliS [Planctomycetota bacterium]|jgi:flagellar protein FliS